MRGDFPGAFSSLRAADVQLYRICDDLSGMLIFPMLVFSPWAFGTTQPWSIWTMNMAGYALGILLLVKLFIRGAKGYTALRWENFSIHSATKTRHRHPLARLLTREPGGIDAGGSGFLSGERLERARPPTIPTRGCLNTTAVWPGCRTAWTAIAPGSPFGCIWGWPVRFGRSATGCWA